ncbi:hypothetical protein AB0O70_00725 [Microbacterium paraoxydans]|uniref:hypothetical protein n=1 Tax=Microbacterium TaxID=33882 RepID=UPI000D012700|nr:hypothetical protein [Microbacterium sp. str. 'China']AVL97448.1 hypothetical protein C6C15_10260 [Microbacterium sp. str. 'China']
MTALPPLDAAVVTELPSSGGHRLPSAFSSGPAIPARPRNRRPLGVLLAVIVAVGAAGTGFAVTQLTANQGYDEAAARVADAARSVTNHQSELRHRTTELIAATDAGHVIIDTGTAGISVGADVWDALDAAVADGEGIGAEAEEVLAAERPQPDAKPAWFWELFPATARLEEDQSLLEEIEQRTTTASVQASDGLGAVRESGVAVISATGQAAGAFEKAHPSTRNAAVIALRDAAADALAVTEIDDAAATTYAALQTAAVQVISAENAELAEKAGPLRGARLEIEAFARSLAPGVLLEFDWAPVVNGAGYNGSMGGYTTWWWDTPGRAVIELSDSVAEQWPAERSKALVAHEVGHAISVKCQDMYDSSTQDSIEKWATAWAISMGFTDDANGVWAYGYPPQNYIDAAAGCR